MMELVHFPICLRFCWHQLLLALRPLHKNTGIVEYGKILFLYKLHWLSLPIWDTEVTSLLLG
jgi:hypothetical protein